MIRVHTLGGLSVRDGDGMALAGSPIQPRRLAVLALLARAGERGILRDKIVALLWPDADDERGPRSLAQALYGLRKDLGAEEAIAGTKELRFDPAFVSSDVEEFAAAVARGDYERAVALHHGPFLDGFNLAGSEEFSTWVDRERVAIAADYSRALESLARAARTAGDAVASATWWGKLAGLEPFNARVAMGLMDALAAAGDRAAAIKHADVYETLIKQELRLPPDGEVLELARRLREAKQTVDGARLATLAQPATDAEDVPAPMAVSKPAVPDATHAPPRRRVGVGLMWTGVAVVALGGVALVFARGRTPVKDGSAGAGRVVAVGTISAFGTDSANAGLTGPAADLLTTSLARVPAIRVVSHGRMLELMHSLGSTVDTSVGGFVNAARQVGATEVIDGTLYALPGGRLRLDLRRVDLASGAIGGVYTVEGSDLFALVDSGTARLVESLGASAPVGSIADVTTRSVTAYRMYEQGVRAYYRSDLRTALGFFDGALAEDSLFAMAAYYAALSDPVRRPDAIRFDRSRRLAARASDRERLMILVGWAETVSSPALRAIAETLATRYPSEMEGHLYSGIARVVEGDFLAGVGPLERVVAMDSLGLRGTRPRCPGCDALAWIVGAYLLADSVPAAEREARRWLRLQPTSETAARSLVGVLEREDKGREADSIFQTVLPHDRSYVATVDYRALHLIHAGDYAEADRVLLAQLRERDPHQQINAFWNLTISLREQGRLTEAVDAAHRARAPLAEAGDLLNGALPVNVLEAQALLEAGRSSAAAALFDSLARQHIPGDAPSRRARNAAWMLTQAAGARYTARDTVGLATLADSIESLGAESGYGRDRRLHHHVRGLLLAARGDDRAAIDEFRSAIYSISSGYSRTNYELARIYLRDHRPRDAVAVLQPVLRGPLDASNLYLNRIELQELLAQAWDSVGVKDSAAVHYQVVASAWAAGDVPFKTRAERARTRGRDIARSKK